MLSNMGQTEQTFYETYTKATLYERRIPFIISGPVDPFSSDSHMERLRHSCRQAEDGNIIVKTVEELEDIAR